MNSAVQLLERAACRYGDAPAFRDERETISFADLRDRARQWGTALLSRTRAGATTPVIVMLPKGVDAVTAFMAVLYSGNPYVPVDVKTPPTRLEKIKETLGDHVLFDIPDAVQPDDLAIDARVAAVTDADPAYIMFTSGSTGMPKGVAVPHRAIIDYGRWVSDTFGFDTTTVMGNQAAFYFANSLFDIYGGLYSGALVDIIPEVMFTFPSKLPAYLNERGITSLFWVPTVMKNIANSGVLETTALPRLKTAAFCGEILSNAYLNIWRRHLPAVRYANLYGMTEGTDACCYFFIERDFGDDEALPIGRPCRNMRAWVLAEDGRECAPGEVGEICIAGAGLALGYWNRNDLTQTAFRRNPLETRWNQTLYHTGDLGLRGNDGLLYVKGRRDSQVKVKGNRVELGEVERAAATLPGAHNVCVLFDPKSEGIVLLIQTNDTELRLRPINQQLKALIPDYMLPSRLELLSQFPLTASGKIDRMRLREQYHLQ
ncbi:MAG: amino acid adenylation domain-containing protein [Actinomycetes bacterium]|jgi:amino acid adenylation domain-containing protein|nr:amino acid adenylation domain-containing protein [Actinomycetes bacterium]